MIMLAVLASGDIGKEGWAFNGKTWEKVRIVDVKLERTPFLMLPGYAEWNSYQVDNGTIQYWTGLLDFVWARPGWTEHIQ